MALETYQVELNVDTLYNVKAMGGTEQVAPSVCVIGTASMYQAQKEPTSNPVTNEMNLSAEATDMSGVKTFLTVPSFVYFTGTVTSIVLSGIEAEVVA